jgi:glycine betaine catabolism B
MNNNNKESVNPWIYRLFKRSGTSLLAHSKAHYAHRYHGDLSHVVSPFSALFSDTEQNLGGFSVSVNSQGASNRPLSANSAGLYLTPNSPSNQSLDGPVAYQNNTSKGSRFSVVNIYDETADTKTFHLFDQAGGIFAYLPGQYITLSLVINDREYKRSYSLASTPSRARTLAVTVKRDSNDGLVSNWLNDHLKIGDTITAKGPFGKFSCVTKAPQKILFLAAGSGIVPIMSMLRWLADTHAQVDVQALLSFRTPDDIIYGDELQLIAARHSNIDIAVTLTTPDIAEYDWFGLTGRVDEAMIRQIMSDVPDRTVYLCGPEGFMAECRKNLLNLHLPIENLVCESFTVNSPTLNSGIAITNQSARKPTGTYQISFAKSGKTIAADGQATLLELAEQSGIVIDYECRNGNCGQCMVKCLKGQVEMAEQAELDDINRKKGWVYSCCSYPSSNIVLEI